MSCFTNKFKSYVKMVGSDPQSVQLYYNIPGEPILDQNISVF